MEILASFGLLFLLCIFLRTICEKLSLPSLTGYMVAGVLLQPFFAPSFLTLSPALRQFALIVILMRAGIGLNLDRLKTVGLSAVFLCFVPAVFEILGYLVLAFLLHLSLLEAALLGAVMAAVSPAVIVPRMLRISKTASSPVPQLILAGASLDDVFCITLFGILLSLNLSGSFSASVLTSQAMGMVLGAAAGLVFGTLIARWNRHVVLLALALSFLYVNVDFIPFNGLVAVFVQALCLPKTEAVSAPLQTTWSWAEMMLFALVGAIVDLSALESNLPLILLVLGLSLVFRAAGVLVSLLPSSLSWKERWFAVISYLPKATVQASLCAIPLSSGLSCGSLVLSFSAAAILVTAPVGAWLIDRFSNWLC